MDLHDAIGIDPDSKACVATRVQRDGSKPVTRKFSLSKAGRLELLDFVRASEPVIIGIEGRNGQSSPLESLFRGEGIPFFSLQASQVSTYRKAMVSTKKNNQIDSQAVAEFLLDLENKNQLPRFVPVQSPDQELRLVARRRYKLAQMTTAAVSEFWKTLKSLAPDLYMVFQGVDPEDPLISLTNKRTLNLMIHIPQIHDWAKLSESKFLKAARTDKRPGWEHFFKAIKQAGKDTPELSSVGQALIKLNAETILGFVIEQKQLDELLSEALKQRPLWENLTKKYKGIGVYLASLIGEELITIDRFKNDDHLASYAGLTKRDYSTGVNNRQIHTSTFNHRLKYALMTAAKCITISDPDSPLARYHRSLIKRGLPHVEATKRTARALVRAIYRDLKSSVKAPEKEKEEAVANVVSLAGSRVPKQHSAPPNKSLIQCQEVIKLVKSG